MKSEQPPDTTRHPFIYYPKLLVESIYEIKAFFIENPIIRRPEGGWSASHPTFGVMGWLILGGGGCPVPGRKFRGILASSP